MRSSKGEHGPVLIDFLLHINGDMSERVMTILESRFPSIEIYSIDEAFADMTGLPDPLESIGRQIQAEVRQKTSIPVGIGIATTKTLAKLANNAAKRWQKQTGGVVDIRDPVRRDKLLKAMPVEEVWGVGPGCVLTWKACKSRQLGTWHRWMPGQCASDSMSWSRKLCANCAG